MKIKINQEECIGCGSCSAVCPDVFDLNDDNKAIIKDTNSDQGESNNECVKEAVDICPVDVIKIEE